MPGGNFYREEVRSRDYYPWETEVARAEWYQDKQRLGIRDLSRAAMVELVRDRFWHQDRSPTVDRTPTLHVEHARTPQREQGLGALEALTALDDGPHGQGLRGPRFRQRDQEERERDQGHDMGWGF